MKYLLSLMLITFIGIAAAEEPDEAFENLIDAFYAGDAAEVEAHLSENSIQMIDMMLMMIKMQPDEAAAELSAELQIALTGDELMNWTSTDFIDALINSPMLVEDLPPREQIQVSGCEVDGDTGTVFLQIEEYPEAIGISMIREGDQWKLSEELIQSEL